MKAEVEPALSVRPAGLSARPPRDQDVALSTQSVHINTADNLTAEQAAAP